jgi:hypothetical protein
MRSLHQRNDVGQSPTYSIHMILNAMLMPFQSTVVFKDGARAAVCVPSWTHASLILPGKLMMEVGRALPDITSSIAGQSPTYRTHPCFPVVSQPGYIGGPIYPDQQGSQIII